MHLCTTGIHLVKIRSTDCLWLCTATADNTVHDPARGSPAGREAACLAQHRPSHSNASSSSNLSNVSLKEVHRLCSYCTPACLPLPACC